MHLIALYNATIIIMNNFFLQRPRRKSLRDLITIFLYYFYILYLFKMIMLYIQLLPNLKYKLIRLYRILLMKQFMRAYWPLIIANQSITSNTKTFIRFLL